MSPDWRDRADCANTERPELFFPPSRDLTPQYLGWARAYHCNPCPVRAECLTFAVEHRMEGIWGGTLDEERRALRRRRQPSRSPR